MTNDLANRVADALRKFCQEQGAPVGSYRIIVGTNQLGRISATLIWDRFDRMEVTQRQEMVWKFIRNHLPTEERDISVIFTRGMSDWVVEEEIGAQSTTGLPWL